MGFGAIGSGIGSGYPAGEACFGISQTTGSVLPIDDQYADRIGGLPDAGHLFHGCGPDADIHRISECPADPNMGGLSGRRFEHGAGIHRVRLRRRTGGRRQLRGHRPNPQRSPSVTTTMLVGQAVAQTPSIFGLLVSFILMFKSFPESTR